MSVYLVQFSYASRSIKSLVDQPEVDHAGQASAMVASIGGKLLGYWYAFGAFDGVVLIEPMFREALTGATRLATRFTPLATSSPSLTTRAPNGPPSPAFTFSTASRMASSIHSSGFFKTKEV